MSRASAGWLYGATATLLLHGLGLGSPHIKQAVLVIAAAYRLRPDITTAWSTHLRYAGIVSGILLLARWLLSTRNTAAWPGPGKVLLFPCKTTHSRLFPEKHSFDYSYLVVGLPVGWEGISGGLVSSSSAKQSWLSSLRKGWYHIDPADYLERGDGHLGLRGKLDKYLESQVRTGKHRPHGQDPSLNCASREPTRRTIPMPTWLRPRGSWDITSTLPLSGTCTRQTCRWLA